jgi:excisionase family DNA binding protein
MTVEEAAEYLFVSHQRIHRLLASGELREVLPRSPGGRLNINVASVQAYRAKTDAAVHAWLNSQTEDNDP